MDKIDTKTKLSALWLFILLNMIFRDLHQLGLKSELEMLLTGTYNGVVITETLMLIGGLMIEIPIAMVLFSLLLTRRIGRPITFLAVFFLAATFVLNQPRDMDDVFFLVVELVALAAICHAACVWPAREESPA